MATSQQLVFLLLIICFPNIVYSGKKIVKEKVHRTKSHDDHVTDDSVRENVQYSLVIEHAFGDESSFVKRGTLKLKSLRTSNTVSFIQEPISNTQIKQLKDAVISNEMYYIRTSTNISTDDDNTNNNLTVTTFISACVVIKSHFTDKIVIHGDGKGNIFGLTLLPSNSVLRNGLECTEDEMMSVSVSTFSTSVSYSTGEQGPSPYTQAFLQKVEVEQAKKETEDNRSFLQKYWLYLIIGFVAFQFLTAGGGGGGGGGQ